MAGDWIKMRTDLYRDPKVCVMADALMQRDGDLARHVNQICQRDMAVTRNVTRNAVVGALVSVWGVMRQRGKRRGADLLCKGATLLVIDDVADMPGFGDAMAAVGWAVDTEEGVEFPGFFDDYNVEPARQERSAGAERQRRYRERKKEESDGSGDFTSDVTGDVTVTPRIEKRREEKEPPCSPPSGDEPAGSAPPEVQEPKPKPRAKREPKPLTTLRTFRAAGGLLVRKDSDPLLDYADRIGLPEDFLRIAAHAFDAKFKPTDQKQANWPQHFRNYVQANWGKLWWDDCGTWKLTTAGRQAEREMQALAQQAAEAAA